LAAAELTVVQQIVQVGWETAVTALKSDAAERVIALDAATNARLTEHRAQLEEQRVTQGSS